MKKHLIFLSLVMVGSHCFGMGDSKPWFGRDKQLYWNNQYEYLSSSPERGQRLNSSLLISPTPSWESQLLVAIKDTSDHSLRLDALQAKIRYKIWDDVIGDPLSLIVGGALRYVSKRALRDRSFIYHSQFEGDLECSIGKEWEEMGEWTSRVWGMCALSIPDEGNSSFLGQLAAEKRWKETHRLKVFAKGREILSLSGHHPSFTPFKGYTRVNYRYMNLGAKYGYEFPVWGIMWIGYQRRIHSKNTLPTAQVIEISFETKVNFF